MSTVDPNSRVPQPSSNHVGKSPPLPPRQQVVKEVGETTIKGTPTQNLKTPIKGTRGSGDPKTDTVVQNQLPSSRALPPTPQERAPLDMGPTKKAPTLVTVAELKVARSAIDKSRNEFVAMMKSGSVPFSKYEDLATTLSFHERRVMGSKASQKEKTEFQKHANEDRQMMFNRLNDDVKTMLQQNKGDLSQTMRACQSILSGTSLIIDTSGASKEKQTYISSEIEKSVVSTLIGKIKEREPSANLRNIAQDIKDLPISHAGKVQIALELKAQYGKG